MISGKRAFHGETSADSMSAILKEEVPELSETRAMFQPPRTYCAALPGENPSNASTRRVIWRFDLESLTEISATSSKSGAQAAVAQSNGAESRRNCSAWQESLR